MKKEEDEEKKKKEQKGKKSPCNLGGGRSQKKISLGVSTTSHPIFSILDLAHDHNVFSYTIELLTSRSNLTGSIPDAARATSARLRT